MPDKPTHVLLITTDEGLRASIDQFRPADASLECVDAQGLTPDRVAIATEIWLDLDCAPATSAVGAGRRVYFHTYALPPQENAPRGLFIHKPCAPPVFQILWAGVGNETGLAAPSHPASSPRALPAWLLDFQELDLKLLCRKCVTTLPTLLGYRIASLYVHDPHHGLLKLADTSHTRSIDATVSLGATDQHLLSAIAQSGHLLQTDRVAAELARRGIPEHPDRLYEGTDCLVGPLISDSRLWGALTFADRVPTAAAVETMPLEEIFAFLGRALHHACMHEQAQIEARVDGLTGLYNQRWMMEALEKEIHRAQRFATPLSALLIDLDGLKAMNDRVGHAAGDCVLRHVARRIAAVLRQFDGAARVGGDEFVVMLPATDIKGARRVAGRLLKSIHDEPVEFEQQTLLVTASIGAVEWHDAWDAHKLLDAADRAMYRAKATGRDRLVCEPPPRPTVVRLGTTMPADSRPAARSWTKEEQRATPQSLPSPAARIDPQRSGVGSRNPQRPVRTRRAT